MARDTSNASAIGTCVKRYARIAAASVGGGIVSGDGQDATWKVGAVAAAVVAANEPTETEGTRELQEVVDRQTADLGQMKERMAAMVSRINELEEDLDTARKDLIKSEDMNTRLQRDLREVGTM